MKRIVLISLPMLTAAAMLAAPAQRATASDHDDGEIDLKARALNLSDHFAFKSPSEPDQLSLVMYFNPRSLPGKQYELSTNARYEFHVSKAANKTSAPTAAEDFVFRFEAGEPNAAGVQAVTLTVLKNGVESGTASGNTTVIGAAAITTNNNADVGGIATKWFIGPRADSFYFDVVRFFQVRAFLASRLFGGAGGNGNAATPLLADNCRGDAFLSILGANPAGGEANGVSDGDNINLFNPPSCAPDFTKNLNVTAIVLNVPIASLGGGTVFDTWSTISVKE